MRFDQNLDGLVWTGQEKIVNPAPRLDASGVAYRQDSKWFGMDFSGNRNSLPWFDRRYIGQKLEASKNGIMLLESIGDDTFILEYNISDGKFRIVNNFITSEARDNLLKMFPGGYARKTPINDELAEYKVHLLDGYSVIKTAENSDNWHPARDAVITKGMRVSRGSGIDVGIDTFFANYFDGGRDRKHIHDVFAGGMGPDQVLPWLNGIAVSRNDRMDLVDVNGNQKTTSIPPFGWLPNSEGIVTRDQDAGGTIFTLKPFSGQETSIGIGGFVDTWAPYG